MSKWDVSRFDEWKSEEFPLGGVGLESGNSKDYETGGWRSMRPVWDSEKCTHCMLCWMHCPDSSILTNDDGKMSGIALHHCKGCGICVEECRFDALTMVSEFEAQEG